MSYEGYTERLCLNGHYSAWDVYGEGEKGCRHCEAPFRYSHGVDQTNGYDEDDPACCDAPKVEIGYDNEWHVDHLGNRYATKIKRYAPTGEGVWVKINSQGYATPPYRDDLAQGMSAGTAKTPKAVEGEARQPGSEGMRPKTVPTLKGEVINNG